jgi:hypothetical protein
MAAAGLYTIGGSFWEFGEPDWEHTRYFMMFGVAEDHDSNPIKAGLGRLKTRENTKYVSVNPVRTGYSAIADEWIGVRPGTDGLFVMALIHELIKAQKVDLEFLVRYTNAPWLVRTERGHPEDGLFLRDDNGNPLIWDRHGDRPVNALLPDVAPELNGVFEMDDGTKARPAFELMARRYLEPRYSAVEVAETTGIPAATIRRIAAELAHAAFEQQIELEVPWTDWAGRRHEKMIGRPVSMHAMRGISAHSNGFHTCRAIHLLQMILGSIDCPGGFRYKPPFPRPCPPGPRPAGKAGEVHPDTPMPGPPLGFVTGPEDLLVNEDGSPRRIDKGFSWEHPFSAHGLMHMVIHNAWAGDPYPVDTLFLYMANMSWNSSMNTAGTMDMLTDIDETTGEYRIPRIIYSDAYASEMVSYADLVLPDTTYISSVMIASACSTARSAPLTARPIPSASRWFSRTATCGRSRTCSSNSVQGWACRLSATRTARRNIPAGIPTTWSTMNARPASARSRVGAARAATSTAAANRIPASSSATSRTAVSGPMNCPGRSNTTSMRTANTWTMRSTWVSYRPQTRSCCSFTVSRCSASARLRAAMAPSSPPTTCASASKPISILCRSGTGRSRKRRSTAGAIPITH